MQRTFLFFLAVLLVVSKGNGQQDPISLQSIASGFSSPVDITHANDDRLFIVEKPGRIRIIEADGDVLSTPYLDIQGRVNSTAGERGLLGLAFHPAYADNGYFFVNYTRNNGSTRVSRFSVTAENSNQADPDSELILMEIEQPFNNHNGGDLAFGPDGYLYIGLGDGGWFGDPGDRSQAPMDLLGKMLRIDVDNGDPYAIPEDNPFAFDDFTADEIWALGLRNPWRFSFDRETGDLWIADVGQDAFEEIDFQAASSTGGENYGWRCYEANAPYNTSGCQTEDAYTAPLHAYSHSSANGCSITGGFVYRGMNQASLIGRYIYADFCSGVFWALTRTDEVQYDNVQLYNGPNNSFSTFGQDAQGELYVASIGNQTIYRVEENCPETPMITEVGASLSTEEGWTSYQWYLNEVPIEGATTAEWTAEESGFYQVEVGNILGCAVASLPLDVQISQLVEHPLISDIQIAPNPFDEAATVSIRLRSAHAVHWSLISTQGQLIHQGREEATSAISFTIPGDQLAAGQYWLNLGIGGSEISLPIQRQ